MCAMTDHTFKLTAIHLENYSGTGPHILHISPVRQGHSVYNEHPLCPSIKN